LAASTIFETLGIIKVSRLGAYGIGASTPVNLTTGASK